MGFYIFLIPIIGFFMEIAKYTVSILLALIIYDKMKNNMR